MMHQILLTDAELVELDELLERELSSTRTEYRRTRNVAFREDLSLRLERTRQLLDKIRPEMSAAMI